MIPNFAAMSEGHLFFVIFMPIVAAASFYYAWRGLRGTRRSWVFSQYFYTQSSSSRNLNNLPLRAAAGGAFALTMWFDTAAEYTNYPELAKGWPIMTAWAITCLPAILGGIWWPPFLGPRWYCDWHARTPTGQRRGQALPYSADELAQADALPDGRAKQRRILDIERCKGLLQALRMDHQRRDQKR